MTDGAGIEGGEAQRAVERVEEIVGVKWVIADDEVGVAVGPVNLRVRREGLCHG